VFWRVELTCDRENCQSLAIAHTRIDENESYGAIGSAVANATPKVLCAEGHEAKINEYPHHVREIEWTGEDGFDIGTLQPYYGA
jgi:hypothetical protein